MTRPIGIAGRAVGVINFDRLNSVKLQQIGQNRLANSVGGAEGSTFPHQVDVGHAVGANVSSRVHYPA